MQQVADPNWPAIAWRIVTPTRPILWPRSDQETWLMNPPNRYCITSDHQSQINDQLESWSDLKTSRYYKQCQGRANLASSRLLVERHRDRGIGDLLFTTGPLSYLQHVNSHAVQIYCYANTDKGHALHGNKDLMHEMPMTGPVIYDTLPQYHSHWFIESATEYDEEPEQINVYDCLYKQLGIDPETVEPKFKRPVLNPFKADFQRADDFFKLIYYERKEDWRKTPYWIVAPTSNSTLRSANYGMWLQVIDELSKLGNVLILGQVNNNLLPTTDISFYEFQGLVGEISATRKSVVNLLGRTPLRLTIGLLACAKGLITLDSGLLYIAQGMRIPAISLWGPQHPSTRIGYDQDYMNLAIWARQACSWCPCFAYRHFPRHKCPQGQVQQVCEPLKAITASVVLKKVEQVMGKQQKAIAPIPAANPKQ